MERKMRKTVNRGKKEKNSAKKIRVRRATKFGVKDFLFLLKNFLKNFPFKK